MFAIKKIFGIVENIQKKMNKNQNGHLKKMAADCQSDGWKIDFTPLCSAIFLEFLWFRTCHFSLDKSFSYCFPRGNKSLWIWISQFQNKNNFSTENQILAGLSNFGRVPIVSDNEIRKFLIFPLWFANGSPFQNT